MVNSVATRQEVRSTAAVFLRTRFPESLFIPNGITQDEEEETVYSCEFHEFTEDRLSTRRVHIYWDDEVDQWTVAFTDQKH